MNPTWSRLSRRSVLIGSVSLLVAACSGTPQDTGTGGDGSATTGGVTTAWPVDITTLYPPNTANPQDGQICNSIYQSLAAYTFEKNDDGSYVQQGSELSPSLAESWEVDADTVTWHLRTDATFYPSGNPLTAGDVAWSAAAWLAGPNAQDLTTNGFQSADDVEVIDDHTVAFHFKTADGKSLAVTPTVLAAYTGGHHMVMDSVEAKKHTTASDTSNDQNLWMVLGGVR